MTDRVPVKGNCVDSGPSLVAKTLSKLSHKHLSTVVPIHCELQLSPSSCSKGPFFDFKISPHSFFNELASFQLTLTGNN